MKISDLKDYISKLPSYEITDDKNSDYRAYTIAYLVQNGGTAKEEELLEDLRITFDNFQEGTALRVVKEGIADAKDGIINLLDFGIYSIADKAWILVECGLKDKDEKEELEESVEIIKYNQEHRPELELDKKEVLDKYGEIFALKNIDKLTKKDYLDFLVYRNNKHWTYLHRDGTNKAKDMTKLRKTLKILVDEKKTIEERFKQIFDPKDRLLGQATAAAILHVASKTKYAVVNKKVLYAQDWLGFLPEDNGYTYWESKILSQEITKRVADRYGFDLWQMDWIWWDIMSGKDRWNEGEKCWLIIPGSSDGAFLPQFIKDDKKDGKISIGYVDLFLPRYLNRDGTSGIHTSKFLEDIRNKMEERELAKATKEKRSPVKITNAKVKARRTYFSQFMQIQEDDVILLWNGSDVLYAKGRAKDNQYRYVKPVKSGDHNHERNVIWEEVYNER